MILSYHNHGAYLGPSLEPESVAACRGLNDSKKSVFVSSALLIKGE